MNEKIISLPIDVQLLPVKQLNFGALKCLYENGYLRNIKVGDVEIVRMIYAALRDENWNTIPPEITNEHLEISEDQFSITYTARYHQDDIAYKADFALTGNGNRLEVIMEGESLSSFKRNRIGLCVHHPVKECSGKQLQIQKPDGTEYSATFPVFINPHQPSLDISKMTWQPSRELSCMLNFEGDVFETEDQRNWTDCSYKTYGTPLSLPLPVLVEKGEKMRQKIILTVDADANVRASNTLEAQPAVPTVALRNDIQPVQGYAKQPFPKIGFTRRAGTNISAAELSLLQQIPFDHYRVEVHLQDSNWRDELNHAFTEAENLNANLELVVFFSPAFEHELQDMLPALTSPDRVTSILPLVKQKKSITTPELQATVYPKIKEAYPNIKVGWGTDRYFAELNRNRPANVDYDFLSYSVNPQVHVSDTRSVIENLEAQVYTLKTIASFAEGKETHIAPITLKMRSDSADERLRYGHDNRQQTSFGAWWMLASIANFSSANTAVTDRTTPAHITLGIPAGPYGILLPGGKPSPFFEALSLIRQFEPKWISRSIDGNSIIIENETGAQLTFTVDQTNYSHTPQSFSNHK